MARFHRPVVASFLLLLCSADAPPAALAEKPSSVAELLQSRIDTAAEGMRLSEQRYQHGMSTGVDTAVWVQRCTDARLDATEDKQQRLAIMREAVDAMKNHESLVTRMFQAGTNASQTDVLAARYDRLNAELRLARALAD
jgi:hypothetical protein